MVGLKKLVDKYSSKDHIDQDILMELIIHALVEFNLLTRDPLENGISFKDPLSDVF